MRIAFIIERINSYRYFSSLIAEGLKRSIEIECWHRCDNALKQGGRAYLYADPAKAPFMPADHPNLSILTFESSEVLQKAIADREHITHIVSLQPPEFVANENTLDGYTGIWCTLMHGPDSFKDLRKFSKILMHRNVRQIFLPYTQHFFDWGMDFADNYLPIARQYFSRNNIIVRPIGFSMFDDSIRNINPNVVREKYGVPINKNILIYLPYSFLPSKTDKNCRAWQAVFSEMHIRRIASRSLNDNSFHKKTIPEVFRDNISYLSRILPDNTARKWLINGWNESAVLKALRGFCDRNDLLLVIKPRRKFDFSEAGYRLADLVIDDDETQQYPSKLQELLSISALGAGFFTTAVIEAAAQGVPFINIESRDERSTDRGRKPWHPNHENSLYNFKGVIRNISVSECIEKLPSMHIGSFSINAERHKEYLKLFVSANRSAAVNFYQTLATTELLNS